MKNARIESKKALEKRFEDSYAEIEENKQFTIAQMKRVHETLNAFQEKFSQELQDLGENLHHQINDEAQFVRDTW